MKGISRREGVILGAIGGAIASGLTCQVPGYSDILSGMTWLEAGASAWAGNTN